MILLTAGADLNVTYVKPSTQKAKDMVHRYLYTQRGDSIYKAYGKPSSRKVDAFFQIVREQKEVDGWGMKITGAGSDVFSCAYLVMAHLEEEKEDKKYLIYHTPTNRFAIPYEEAM